MNLRERALRIGLGTVAAQFISAASLILIPKFYTPSEFGLFILILSTATFIQPFATLRIEILSTVTRKHEDSKILFWFVKRLSVAVSIIGFFLIFLFSIIIASKSIAQSAGFSLAVTSVVLIQSIAIILVQERLRTDHLKKVALSGVLQNGTTLISQLALSGTKFGGLSLILGYMFGRIVSIFKLRTVPHQDKKSKYSFHFIKYYNLPVLLQPIKKVFPTAIFDAITIALPILFVARIYGTESAGIIGLLQSIALVPVTLVSSMIIATLYSQSTIVQELGFTKMYMKYRDELGRQISKIILSFFIISLIFGGIVLPKILDDKWAIDFRLLLLISATYSLQMITYPTIGILSIIEKFNVPRNFASLKCGLATLLCILFIFNKVQWVEFALIFYSIQLLINTGFVIFVRIKSKSF